MSNNIDNQIKKFGKQVITFLTQNGGSGQLKVIGKPCKFNSNIDPKSRISDYIKHKMNIVDLIPCQYTVGVGQSSTNDSVSSDKHFGKLENIRHVLQYQEPIKEYEKMCGYYSLTPYAGLRLLTTDETTSTDEFRNGFENNIIAGAINKLSQVGRNAKTFGKSIGGDVTKAGSEFVTGKFNDVLQFTGNAANIDQSVIDSGKKMSASLANVLIQGNSVSMPKIWDNSSYQPNNNIVINLVSPYGSNKAIHEFIIKPLTYLLLMSLPKTQDGISYGFPHMISLKAYGISEVSIGSIAGLTLHRGGNDTSFNKDKQPLSVNVSLEIINLIDGCASYDKLDAYESEAIANSLNPQSESNIFFQNGSTLLQTPGKIIKSLSPFKYNTLDTTELGLDGNFSLKSNPLAKNLTDVTQSQSPNLNNNTKDNINIEVSRQANAINTAQTNGKTIQKQPNTTVENKTHIRSSYISI